MPVVVPIIGPTLSPIECSRLADAAELAASGVKIRWVARRRRLFYTAHGKEHMILSVGTDRVFAELYKRARAEWKRLNEVNSLLGIAEQFDAAMDEEAGVK